MNPNSDTAPASAPESTPRRKPRLALAIATVLGVGYVPKAPGTCGSLVGVVLAPLTNPLTLVGLIAAGIYPGMGIDVPMFMGRPAPALILLPSLFALLLVAWLGVWSARKAASYANTEDPQHVVIDEVSGQLLTLILPLIPIALPSHILRTLEPGSESAAYLAFTMLLLDWKYLLLGFILFRGFDIWKPYPLRKLEKLHGGWGIMADDWMAGIYAALVLRLVLHLGLI